MRSLGFIVVVLALVAGLVSPGIGSAAPAEVEPSSTAVTTDRLNLRTGPSGADPVIAVMPAGVTVTLSGQSINNYLFVTWGIQNGWAHREWLEVTSVPSQQPSIAITTDRVNMRASASLTAVVITVLPQGTTVTLTGQSSNGFRSVSYNGRAGWVFGTYLADGSPEPVPSTTATVTERLNLRSGPSTADGVVTVLPAGATVSVSGSASNGYYLVVWNGYRGWAHGDWLRFPTTPDPDPEPEPEPEPPPQTNGVTTANLNLRSQPSTASPVLALIPNGTRIVLTGGEQNGFLAVSWEGRSGWAHGDWITADGAVPVPTGAATTTDRLNLRSGPATSYPALVVIPAGETVTLTGQESNGFRSVKWNGFTGWAFGVYLEPVTTAPPEPLPFDVTNTIVGPVRGTVDQALAAARARGALRIDEVESYIREVYRLAPEIGFDPAIIVAQSAHETGYWTSHYWNRDLNPAGMGITGGANQLEPVFPSGTVSARAQIAHMHAEVFGNSRPLPPVLQGVDPVYQRVFDAGWAGTIRTISDLSGTWAVDPEYHHKIVNVARFIFGE